jgi:hypothetical protein
MEFKANHKDGNQDYAHNIFIISHAFESHIL